PGPVDDAVRRAARRHQRSLIVPWAVRRPGARLQWRKNIPKLITAWIRAGPPHAKKRKRSYDDDRKRTHPRRSKRHRLQGRRFVVGGLRSPGHRALRAGDAGTDVAAP